MANDLIFERLSALQQMMVAAHSSNGSMSSSSKGSERETFIREYLCKVFPTPFRFGTGDVTDYLGNRSGQMDIVIEYPFVPSFPLPGNCGVSRLYLAEGVAAVIEVKSDITNQWSKVVKTAKSLQSISRKYGNTISHGPFSEKRIPLFAVGYTGWKNEDTVRKKIESASANIDGILIVDPGIFVSSPEHGSISVTGPWALWGLITCLHNAAITLITAYSDLLSYAR